LEGKGKSREGCSAGQIEVGLRGGEWAPSAGHKRGTWPPKLGHAQGKKRGRGKRGGGCPLGFVKKRDQSGGEKKKEKIRGVHGHGHMPRKEREIKRIKEKRGGSVPPS
jgi:hypothetical protein